MSQNVKDQQEIDNFKKVLEKDAELERIKADLNEKRTRVELKRYTNLANQMDQDEKDLDLAKNLDLREMSQQQILEIQHSNDQYMEAASACMKFICDTFEGFIPFFRKNLILVGAESGHGKSTIAANVAYRTMQQINPATGKKCNVLIITNEEQSEDFINRITCLNKGWDYSNHSTFTTEQKDTFRRAIPLLTAGGRLTVIDDDYGGAQGMTTSLEGLESIFENLVRNNIHYDAIIIDYYQHFTTSKVDPSLDEYKVQDKVGRLLDHYKNVYSAPIIVLSQLKPNSQDSPRSFKERIEGRKSIYNVSTIAMEVVAVREDLKTNWTIWKSRFNKGIGSTLKTGFDKGMYVKYTNEFIENVQRMKAHRESHEMDKAIGLKDVFDKDKKDGN
jgi:hypothetical protein